MAGIDKLLKKIKDAADKGRLDLVEYYASQIVELARLNADTEYLPSGEKNGH